MLIAAKQTMIKINLKMQQKQKQEVVYVEKGSAQRSISPRQPKGQKQKKQGGEKKKLIQRHSKPIEKPQRVERLYEEKHPNQQLEENSLELYEASNDQKRKSKRKSNKSIVYEPKQPQAAQQYQERSSSPAIPFDFKSVKPEKDKPDIPENQSHSGYPNIPPSHQEVRLDSQKVRLVWELFNMDAQSQDDPRQPAEEQGVKFASGQDEFRLQQPPVDQGLSSQPTRLKNEEQPQKYQLTLPAPSGLYGQDPEQEWESDQDEYNALMVPNRPLRRDSDQEREAHQALLERRQQRIRREEEQERQQNQEQHRRQENQQHHRYVNCKDLEAAINSKAPGQALIKYFERFYPKMGQLRAGVDNVNLKLSPQLFKYLMNALLHLARSGNKQSLHFIIEIFSSKQFMKLLEEEIEYYMKSSINQPQQLKQDLRYFLEDLFEIYCLVQVYHCDEVRVPITLLDQLLFNLKNCLQRQGHWDLKQKYDQIKLLYMDIQLQKEEQEAKKQQAQRREQEFLIIQNIPITYRDCPCFPVNKEFESDLKKRYATPYYGTLFAVQQKEPYPHVETFYNNHFYILREDYISGFRQAVHVIKQTGFSRLSRDILSSVSVYVDLEIHMPSIDRSNLQLKISMEFYEKLRKQIDWSKTSRLMQGSLLALVAEDFSVMVFVKLRQRPNGTGRCSDQRFEIEVSLTEDSLLDQIQSLALLLRTDKRLYAIENKVYFETYIHYLNCLQQAQPDSLPFKKQLVFAERVCPYPRYLEPHIQKAGKRIKYKVNLKFELHKRAREELPVEVNLFSESWPDSIKASLDESQVRAIQLILKSGIALVQGPPGTGKTYCGALAVRILLQNQSFWSKANMGTRPILIVCYTNHALDQFLQHILTFVGLEKIVRVGGRSKDEQIQSRMLSRLSKGWKSRNWFRHNEYFQNRNEVEDQIRRLLNRKNQPSTMRLLETYADKFAKRIVSDFFRMENLSFKRQCCQQTLALIYDIWSLEVEPSRKQISKLIEMECKENRNELLKKKQVAIGATRQHIPQRPKACSERNGSQVVFVQKSQTDSMTHQCQGNYNEYSDEDDMEMLDSDEEQNRLEYIADEPYDGSFRLKGGGSREQDEDFSLLFLAFDKVRFSELQRLLDNQRISMWQLSLEDRETILKHALNLHFDKQVEESANDFTEFQKFQEAREKYFMERDLEILASHTIIGVTVTGCAKYASHLKLLEFGVMVIEEAAEVLESHSVAIISQNVEHLILIGDHQQLRPKLESYFLEQKYQTNISLFERLINNGLPHVTLQVQRRMRKDFADFIRLIYGAQYADHYSVQTERNEKSVPGLSSNLLFFDHRQFESSEFDSSSRYNSFEAGMISNLAKHLVLNKVDPAAITILSFYMKQALKIKTLLNGMGVRNVQIKTVDNYQGEENDVIILSLVRSNRERRIGFIGVDNRICVALSRARIGLYVFGNFEFIEQVVENHLRNEQKAKYSRLWLDIMALAREKKVLANTITVKCQSHSKTVPIKTVDDWKQVPKGGCTRICNIRFECGHVCESICHQGLHTRKYCVEKCNEELPCGHVCQYPCKIVPCPPCGTIIARVLSCSHLNSIKCSEQYPSCGKICSKILPCNHPCQQPCKDKCDPGQCSTSVTIPLTTCPHIISVQCRDRNVLEKLICKEPCQQILACGHKCEGSCGTCLDLFHKPCQHLQRHRLMCGHLVDAYCGQYSIECQKEKRQFQRACCFSECNERCIDIGVDHSLEICAGMMKPKCDHQREKMIQYQSDLLRIFEQEPCDQPCMKQLKCGCKCLGLCGEVCPSICNSEEHDTFQQKVLMNQSCAQGQQNAARYYEIECKSRHIVDVAILDSHVMKFASQKALCYLLCPICSQIVYDSSRYRKWTSSAQELMIQARRELRASPQEVQILEFQLENTMKNLRNMQLKDKNEFLAKLIRTNQEALQKQEPITKDTLAYRFNSSQIYLQLLKLEKEAQTLRTGINRIDPEFQRQIIVVLGQYFQSDEFSRFSNNQFWLALIRKMNAFRLYLNSITLLYQNNLSSEQIKRTDEALKELKLSYYQPSSQALDSLKQLLRNRSLYEDYNDLIQLNSCEQRRKIWIKQGVYGVCLMPDSQFENFTYKGYYEPSAGGFQQVQ